MSDFPWLVDELQVEGLPQHTPIQGMPIIHMFRVTESQINLIESGVDGNVPFTLDLQVGMYKDFIRELEIESQYEENPLFDFKFIPFLSVPKDQYIFIPLRTCVVKEWEVYKSCLRICLQVVYV